MSILSFSKPQTPLTDAENKRTGWPSFYYDFARSLELKLQEAERQRGEAIRERDIEKRHWIEDDRDLNELINKLVEAERQRDEARKEVNAFKNSLSPSDIGNAVEIQNLTAERDQLIKVVDELADIIRASHRDCAFAVPSSYNSLPHVQAKKGNKG